MHRVLWIHQKCAQHNIVSVSHQPSATTGEVKFLTKGDNNHVDDRGLYASVGVVRR